MMLEQNQIVISATKPLTDEDSKCVFYDVDLLKLNGNQLKIGTFRISTPLDDEIKGTPELVYLKKADDCQVETLEVKTIPNVDYIKMCDDDTLILQEPKEYEM